MKRKPLMLAKRYNKDGSITLVCGGYKVNRFSGTFMHDSIKSFAEGWYGDHPVIWGRTQFADRRKTS